MTPPRLDAARLLYRFLESNEHADQEGRQQNTLAPLTRELLLGCYRQLVVLDWILKQLVDRKPDLLTRAFLLPAIYEILFLDGTPDHAVVHETMEGAKKKLKQGQLKFLNAILRRCCRERDDLLKKLGEAPAKIKRSHPPRLIEQWDRFYSGAEIDAICTWDNSRAPICLRIAPAYATVEQYLETLRNEEIEAVVHPHYSEQFIELQQSVSIAKLPGFGDGAFYVQDPSTVHAPLLLAAQPGERILDVCAAPGGKTLLIAEAMQGEGTLIALDKQAQRVQLLKQNLARMNQSWVKTMTREASSLVKNAQPPTEKFDGILLDAPCSNTGVLRRRPEARWRYSTDSIKQLNELQTRLLDTCAALLKPGGRLVYSTCSIEPAENEQLIEKWLQQHPRLQLDESELVLPGKRLCDGSFAARITSK